MDVLPARNAGLAVAAAPLHFGRSLDVAAPALNQRGQRNTSESAGLTVAQLALTWVQREKDLAYNIDNLRVDGRLFVKLTSRSPIG
jgi:hypothetical protein